MERRARRRSAIERSRAAAGRAQPSDRGGAVMDPTLYLERYLEPLGKAQRTRRARAELPALAMQHFYPDAQHADAPPDLTLGELYAAGVECGHAEAREELKRRVTSVAGHIERRVAMVAGALQSRIGQLEQ